jgi:sarcosine oxidase subunit beta
MQTADVVVVGAGINGASTAYNLAKRGAGTVVLIEKQLLASGGTGRSAAIIRQHYSTEELVKMVRRSTELFHHFDDEVGGDSGFVNTGWAFLVPEDVSEGLTANLEMGRRLGVDVREISKEDLLEMEPRIELGDVFRIAYEPGSGYADPRATTHSYVRRFVELGGQLKQLCAVTGLRLEGDRIAEVETEAGPISTGVVVNAAGPWSGRLAAMAGVTLPIEVTREEEIIYATAAVGGPPRLCFSDMAKAIYYRPDGRDNTLVGRGFPKEYEHVNPDGYDQEVDVSFIAEAERLFHQRLPALASSLALNSYTGLYDVTPDWHPVLGRVEGIEGFYLCAGFSGHGFKIGPAVGELMAEEVVDGGAHTVDLGRFGVDRFETGALIEAAYGANRA